MYFRVGMSKGCMPNSLIATYEGLADSSKDAMILCVKRAWQARKITYKEHDALIRKIKFDIDTPGIDTWPYRFGVIKGAVKSA